jgi:hypothetical protein
MIPIRPQADATNKLSRGAKAESITTGVSIDRLDQIGTADAVPSTLEACLWQSSITNYQTADVPPSTLGSLHKSTTGSPHKRKGYLGQDCRRKASIAAIASRRMRSTSASTASSSSFAPGTTCLFKLFSSAKSVFSSVVKTSASYLEPAMRFFSSWMRCLVAWTLASRSSSSFSKR